MTYEDKLDLILKVIVKHDFIVISHEELREAIKNEIPGETHNFTNDLIALGYIEPNSTSKNGRSISGFSPKEKGKDFLAKGSFASVREKEIELYKLSKDSVSYAKSAVFWAKIAALLAVITIFISLKDCSNAPENQNGKVYNSQDNKQSSPTLQGN